MGWTSLRSLHNKLLGARITVVETSINYIAWWGAVLSTLLAVVKLFELWRDRFRIDVGYGFSGDAHQGNDIHIRNLSGNPVILAYWELFYRPHFWPLQKDIYIDSPEACAYDLKIEPHSSKTFNFSDQEHFSWGRESMKGHKIYIRLHFAGRRSFIKKVYG